MPTQEYIVDGSRFSTLEEAASEFTRALVEVAAIAQQCNKPAWPRTQTGQPLADEVVGQENQVFRGHEVLGQFFGQLADLLRRQVGAELGVFGIAIFVYLVFRAYSACFAVNRLLRGPPRKRAARTTLALTDADRTILSVNAKGMLAAMVGWTVCAFFASVAFNWTFYYVLALAAAGREIARSRRTAAEPNAAASAAARELVRAHA